MSDKIDRVDFCSWEGGPALLVHYKDGRIYGFTKYGDKWAKGHAPDIATKARLITKDQFNAIFGSLALPDFPG